MGEFSGADAIAVAALSWVFVNILTGPIARALADRLRGVRPRAGDPEVSTELAALRSRLVELEERLDFAERLLASGRQVDQMPGGVHR
jgi:hypothetical protein